MDILAGLQDKLRFIERFYEAASATFREIKRKIDVGEYPYIPACFDPETADDEPPFLSEWQEAEESLDLLGQAALTLVQGSFREYLDWFLKLSQVKLSAQGANWLERYKNEFRDTLSVDWNEGPVSFPELEEINFARNDIVHPSDPFVMTRYQSAAHRARFPSGLFVDAILPARISVTAENLAESIRRVESFCKFLDLKRSWW